MQPQPCSHRSIYVPLVVFTSAGAVGVQPQDLRRSCVQVFCLKAVRAMERGDEWVSEIYDNYSPNTSEVRFLGSSRH